MEGETSGGSAVGGGNPSSAGVPGAVSVPSAAKAPAAAATSPQSGVPQGTPSDDSGSAETPAEKRYKLRVGKREVEVTRAQLLDDLEKEIGEDGVLDLHKLRRGSYERFEESKKAQTELQKMQRMLDDPNAVFEALAKKHGPEAAARLIEQQYKRIDAYRKMTPEQRQQWQQRQQHEAEKREIAQFKEQRAREERAKATTQQSEVVKTKFTEALTTAGVPVNAATIARMAMHAKDLLKRGVPATYGDVAKAVQEDIRNELRSLIKGMPREKLREYLGDEHIVSIRQMELEALEQQGPQATQPRGQDGKFVPLKGKPTGASNPEPKRKVPIGEWRKRQIEERRRG